MRTQSLLALFAAGALSLFISSCGSDPSLQGGGYVTPSVMVGYGNWSGAGVGFGAYAREGGILGGTSVCLFQDTNGDGKLECGEAQACVKKTSGGPEKYVTGGATQASGNVPPPGFICGEVKYRDKNGNDNEACVLVSTQPGAQLDVCGLRACCKCVDCPEQAAGTDEDGGGRSLGLSLAALSVQQPPAGHRWYDLRDELGQLEMRVSHDGNGTSWTILAGSTLQAGSIERIEVNASGVVVDRVTLSATPTGFGLLATYDAAPKSGVYTIFSARGADGPLRNYFVNSTTRPDVTEEEYFSLVYDAVLQ